MTKSIDIGPNMISVEFGFIISTASVPTSATKLAMVIWVRPHDKYEVYSDMPIFCVFYVPQTSIGPRVNAHTRLQQRRRR